MGVTEASSIARDYAVCVLCLASKLLALIACSFCYSVLVAFDGDVTSAITDSNISHVIVESLDVSTWDADVSLAVSKLSRTTVSY